MNSDKSGWARRYQKALGRYLEAGPSAGARPAHLLGRRAVALGLETLDVARIHRQALRDLAPPEGPSGKGGETIERAASFFAETIFPIEQTHPAARKAEIRAGQLTEKIRQRTEQSSAATRRLTRSVARRRAAEAALKKSSARHEQLLRETRRLRDLLRRQTSEMLADQEGARKKTSRQLHDETAQTLAAINVRLLTLRELSRSGTETLKKEVAETQRLVAESAKMINQYSYEKGLQPEK